MRVGCQTTQGAVHIRTAYLATGHVTQPSAFPHDGGIFGNVYKRNPPNSTGQVSSSRRSNTLFSFDPLILLEACLFPWMRVFSEVSFFEEQISNSATIFHLVRALMLSPFLQKTILKFLMTPTIRIGKSLKYTVYGVFSETTSG